MSPVGASVNTSVNKCFCMRPRGRAGVRACLKSRPPVTWPLLFSACAGVCPCLDPPLRQSAGLVRFDYTIN